MSATYQANKKYIYAWRNNHREEYNERCRVNMKKAYQWQKIKLIFLQILLD
jgi:hypothetical protein